MSVGVGDHVPDARVWTLGRTGPQETRAADLLNEGTVVLFAVPGAFTPTCSDRHLPGFATRAQQLRDKGVDRVVCLAVNDSFVMAAWGRAQGVGDDVVMVSDGNGEFTQAMGLVLDGSSLGLGSRSQRYAAVIRDGIVSWMAVEKGPGLEVSSAEAVLAAL